MASGRRRVKRPYAFFIIGLMLAGAVAGAFFFYRPGTSTPSCGASAPTFSKAYSRRINGLDYRAINTNFTGAHQAINFFNVTFVTIAFSDPSKPHLVNNACVTDATSSATISLQVSFQSGRPETLSITYRGSSTGAQGFTAHNNPQAGIVWNPNDPHVTLLVSES